MEIEHVRRPSQRSTKIVNINLKITKEVSRWLKSKGISPTLLFDKAVEELQKKEGSKNGK